MPPNWEDMHLYQAKRKILRVVRDDRRGRQALSASLTVAQFSSKGTQTHLKLTVYVATFEAAGYNRGYQISSQRCARQSFETLERCRLTSRSPHQGSPDSRRALSCGNGHSRGCVTNTMTWQRRARSRS